MTAPLPRSSLPLNEFVTALLDRRIDPDPLRPLTRFEPALRHLYGG